jgi:hypothetical protein
VSKWIRTGRSSAFGTSGTETEIGWSWEIKREGDQPRLVRVEVTREPFRATDLPEEARNAIRSRGATAVDAFLYLDDPPGRIIVSKDGVHARNDPPRASEEQAPRATPADERPSQ